MVNIKNVLDSVSDFSEICRLAKLSKPQLSSWGARSISVVGYDGILPIDALAKKCLQLLVEGSKDPFDHGNQLAIRKELSSRIDQVYDLSDEQVRTGGCFTRLMVYLRSFRLFHPNFTPLRWIWREIEGSRRDVISVREAIKIWRVDGLGEFKLYLDTNPESTFWEQFYEDLYWNVLVLLPH